MTISLEANSKLNKNGRLQITVDPLLVDYKMGHTPGVLSACVDKGVAARLGEFLGDFA